MSDRARRGIVIPVVLTFSVVVFVFAWSMIRSRTASKLSNLVSFHYLKGSQMAEAGIQHAMLKIRLFPDEAFEAAARQFGLCPMGGSVTASGNGNPDLMQAFIADMKCEALNIPGTEGWGYKVTAIDTKAAFRKNNKLVTVIEITSEGWALDKRGDLGTRKEVIKKTVSIFKAT